MTSEPQVRWRRRWRTWRSLQPSDRFILVQAIFLLPICRLALSWFGLQRCRRSLARLTPLARARAAGNSTEIVSQAKNIARLVDSAAYLHPLSTNCLQRSLALWWILRRQHIESEIRIGTRHIDGNFEAHAWVECSGTVVNDSDTVHQRYAAFAELPTQRP